MGRALIEKSIFFLFVSIILILTISNGIAADSIRGVVTDKSTGKPLLNVNVSILGTSLGAASDKDGQFVIKNVPAGVYTIQLSSVGYKTVTLSNIKLIQGETTRIDIELQPTVLETPEIVVTATRREGLLENTPEITFITNARTIEAMGAKEVGDVLPYLPGVSVEGGTGSGQPFKKNVSINGLPAIYSLVMVDGVRLLSSHFHTGTNVNMVPPENIERIELVKGAASAQYGSDGIGGVLNIITKRGSDKPALSFMSYGGSQNTSHTGLSIIGSINQNISHSIFTSWEQSDGLPIKMPEFRKDALNYTLFTIMDRVDAQISKDIETSASVHYASTATPYKSSPYYSWLITPRLDMRYNVSENFNIRTSGYFSQWKSERNNELNEITSPEITFGYGGLKNHFFLAGAEYIYRKFERNRVSINGQHTYGLFLQDEFTPWSSLSILAALRMDKVEEIDPVISPKLSFLYKFNSALRLRTSIGRGFRAPTVQELYETLYSHPGDIHFRAGNRDLKPEYSTSLTAGIEWKPYEQISLMVNGYSSFIDNMITPVDHGLEDPTLYFSHEEISFVRDSLVYIYRRENIHKAIVKGIEFKAQWNIFSDYRVEGGMSIIHNENKDTKKSLPYYPGKNFSLSLIGEEQISKNFSIKGFIGLMATNDRKIWRFKHDQEQEVGLNDYQKLDASLSLVFAKKYEVFFNVDNILAQELHMYEDVELLTEGQRLFRCGFRIRAF